MVENWRAEVEGRQETAKDAEGKDEVEEDATLMHNASEERGVSVTRGSGPLFAYVHGDKQVSSMQFVTHESPRERAGSP